MPEVAEASPATIETAPNSAPDPSSALTESATSESTNATATQPAEAEDSSDADYQAWKKDQPADDEAIDPLETKQTTRDEKTGKFTAPDKPAPAPVDLSPEDAAMLKRRGLELDDLPTDPLKREKFLRRQAEKQTETDRAFQNFRQGKTGDEQQQTDPTQQQGLAANKSPDLDAQWAGLGEQLFTEEGPKHLRSAVQAEINRQMAQANPASSEVGRVVSFLADREFKSALSDWTAPQGVDAKSADVDKAIRAKADILAQIQIQEGKHPLELDFKQLALDAANLVFPNKQQAIDQQRSAAVRARRGSPESGTRAPTTGPRSTEDQLESDWFAKNPRK